MAKTIMICLLVMGMLASAAIAFPVEAPLGVAPLPCMGAQGVPNSKPVPYGTTNCGGYTCANDGSCCGTACCPSGYNLYCKDKNLCYNTTTGAQGGCGDNYEICPMPAK